MEDNLADDDIEIELAPIAVQLGYVQQVIMTGSFFFSFFVCVCFLRRIIFVSQ